MLLTDILDFGWNKSNDTCTADISLFKLGISPKKALNEIIFFLVKFKIVLNVAWKLREKCVSDEL